jgi:hypothetical protein
VPELNSQSNNNLQEAANADVEGQEEEVEHDVDLSPEGEADGCAELDGDSSAGGHNRL